jgi:hypothetical protein
MPLLLFLALIFVPCFYPIGWPDTELRSRRRSRLHVCVCIREGSVSQILSQYALLSLLSISFLPEHRGRVDQGSILLILTLTLRLDATAGRWQYGTSILKQSK